MSALWGRIRIIIAVCLPGSFLTVAPTVAQTLAPPASAPTVAEVAKDSIGVVQSTRINGEKHDLSGENRNEAHTASSNKALENQPFRIPRPVSTEPFDYTALDPQHYTLEPVRISGKITLDGRLTEEEWQWPEPAINFYQLQPAEGYPATQSTEVRVLYDDKNLYVGFMCYDDNPDLISARDMQRDARIAFSNDMVQVVIAPLEGGREAYTFQTNPNGARSDSFVSQEGANFDTDWNGNWNAASETYAYGWSTEFVIPFYVLRFPSKPVQNWSINFGRRIQRNREDTYWVPLSRRDGQRALYRFGKGGRLAGLENIKPGGKVQLLPFSVLGSQGTRHNTGAPTAATPIAVTDFNYGLQRQFGGDLKWSITSGLTLNSTVNPDFAQVEADDQIVNLSRFEFRFDEKRPFFLERSDIFSFQRRSGRGDPFQRSSVPQLFFSRRIGRQLPNGSSVPIDLGMRITGKINTTTIGYLNVQTRETDYDDGGTIKTESMTNWQALRVSQDVGARSSVGVLATFKEPDPGLGDELVLPIPRYSGKNFSRVLALDGTLASRRTQHEFQVIGAKSWTDTLHTGGQEMVWYAAQRWRNRWMDYNISYKDIGKNFVAQTGFIPQRNIRSINGAVNVNPLIRRYGVRSVFSTFNASYTVRRDDRFFDPERWDVVGRIAFELEKGIWVLSAASRSFDTLSGSSNKKIAGVHFVPDSYTFDQAVFAFFTNQGKSLSGNAFLNIGKFYGADLRSVLFEGRYAPNPRLSFNPGLTWTHVKRSNRNGLAADEYDYNNRLIPRFRINYSFTPNFQVSSFVQFNADKQRPQDAFHLNTVTANFLIAYRSPYGHSFFLAVNQFHDDALDTDASLGPFTRTPLRRRDQTVVAKVSYLFNL